MIALDAVLELQRIQKPAQILKTRVGVSSAAKNGRQNLWERCHQLVPFIGGMINEQPRPCDRGT